MTRLSSLHQLTNESRGNPIETTFTVRKMTGHRISGLSTILLLCAAVLLTKSCGILALSGEGSSAQEQQLAAQAEPWSDATTTTIQPGEEGSGWDTTLPTELTTEANEETTLEAQEGTTVGSGEGEISTAAPETSPAGQDDSSPAAETTVAPEETSSAAEDTSPAPEETTTAEADAEASSSSSTAGLPESSPSSSSTVAPESSSSSTAAQPESSSSSSSTAEPESSSSSSSTAEPESSSSSSSSAAPGEATIAPTPPTFQCQAAGLFPHISGDCRRYHKCLLNPVLRQLQEIEVTCPPLTAFSSSLGRCVRDVAECQEDSFQCLAVGRFAGHDDTFYYSCVASLQGGFHKFIVRCSSGQRFEAVIGGCWRYDWTQIVPGQEATEVSDLAAIKRELKLYKAEEKLRLKATKEQEKLAKKQQKLEEKAAKKAAKEQAKQQAKAEKDKAKGESIESAESSE
ncbi:uncharacterized protein DDB_G0271670 [Drosophila elegans]|uniref:uncharacterized protein DDB_G0271670 n=1 Tax=Drosophila elegans TaxID=30023 RepID=UPI0007E7094A|nr:uncharacterized protein DDB_G0271670 [Drosophila elegans]